MSSLRPGTVDYSKWDSIDVSDSEEPGREPPSDSDDGSEGNENEEGEAEFANDDDMESSSSDDESSDEKIEGGGDSDSHPPPTKRARESTCSSAAAPLSPPAASLATLQRAWKTDSIGDKPLTSPSGAGSSDSNERMCSACLAPNPPCRCSRCQMAWFCDVNCQKRYHPVHKKECIDTEKHFQYWGFLNHADKRTEQERRADLEKALLARLNARRRRALKRAAAAAAVERARLAREARGNAKGSGKGKGDEREETCCVCQCEFTVSGDGGVGLCCPSSHRMCAECTGIYVSSVLGDLDASYPPKCPMCRGEIPGDHFEAQLTTKQQASVKAFSAQRALQPGQILAKCSECDFFEVEPHPGSVVWWCGRCGHGTCFVCNKDLPRDVEKYDLEKSPHATCKALRRAKAMVEGAIGDGSKMKCPGCGLAGRKDDACTHMTCPKCATVWCYVCGLHEGQCDKAPPSEGRPANDIYLHNRDWEVNEARCPMYLTQILEVDLGWLGNEWENRATDDDFEDDEKCLDYFHRFRTIKKLQEVWHEVGPDDFQAVFEKFDSIKNSGYTLEEVITTSTDKLIDREEYLRYREVEQEGSETNDGEGDEDLIPDDDEVGSEDEMNEDNEFERVPVEMTRAVAQEEEQMRQALEASQAEHEGLAADSFEGSGDTDAKEGEEADCLSEGDEFEKVPQEMTDAVVQEEEQMHQALEASKASAQEDELLRRVIAESSV